MLVIVVKCFGNSSRLYQQGKSDKYERLGRCSGWIDINCCRVGFSICKILRWFSTSTYVVLRK
jgi:hypothetical protein